MSLVHKAALVLIGVFALVAVIAALTQVWELAWICFVVLLVGIFGAVLYGNETARRRLPGYGYDTPAPAIDQASLTPAHDPTLVHLSQEIRRGGRLQWFSALARETRLTGARDVLSLAATGGAYDYSGLTRHIELLRFRGTDHEGRAQLHKILWLPAYFSLARVLYSQRLNPRDLFTCLALYDFAEDVFGLEAIDDGIDRSYYSDLLVSQRRFTKAAEVLDYKEHNGERAYSQRWLRLNTVNPNLTGDPHKAGEWNGRLAEAFQKSGLTALEFADPAAPSFYEISCQAPVAEDAAEGGDQPLISVIMPIYEPNAATDVAIQSLLNQSWRNTEIIIIDDASPQVDDQGNPTPYRAQLESWAAKDQRIRLVLCEQNRGAYAVRNDAFELAQGEFVTIADKDDWHHPQRLERQAKDLIENPDKPANIVNWVRVNEDLQFQVRWGPDRVIHPSFASILFRRETVLEKLGFWDAVRKSADNEYKKRLELVFDTRLVADDPIPMAFSLLGEDNLTSTDFGLGYRHPDREIYQHAYGRWHEEIRDGASPYMPKNPEQRIFQAPPSFLPGRDKTHVPHYDVVYLSEFGLHGGNALGLQQEIEAALAAGLKVGILALQNALIPSAAKRRLVPEIEQLFLSGRVDWLTLDRKATADLLVIHWPAVLELALGLESSIQVSQSVVVANQLPAASEGAARYYSVDRVSANVRALFGVDPYWVAQSPVAGRLISAQVPAERALDTEWNTPSDDLAELPVKAADPARAPVVGRAIDEAEGEWPYRTAVEQIYGSAELSVSLRSHDHALRQRGFAGPQGAYGHWHVEPPGQESYRDYLASLDFLVHYSSLTWSESFEPSVVAAVEAGVVVVLDPALESVFGKAAVYAPMRNARSTVLGLWQDPEAYAVQRQEALDHVRSSRSAAAYAARLKTLIGVTSAEGAGE